MEMVKCLALLLALSFYMAYGADVSGKVEVPKEVRNKDVTYRVQYRELHGSVINQQNARIAKLECSQEGTNYKRTKCFKNTNPHSLCDYTTQNAGDYYKDLARTFGHYWCKARTIKSRRFEGNKKDEGCTWTEAPCPVQNGK